jgi:hypothetical protein
VPGAGIEPAQPYGPRDFKSLASTYSATQAQLKTRFLSSHPDPLPKEREIINSPRGEIMESLPPVDRADEIYKDQYMLMGGFYMLWHYLSSIQVGLIIQKTLFIRFRTYIQKFDSV